MPAATPLDGLLALMKTLQDRIAKHGGALRKSEALTRYALIDPLLRELGWDTSDPAQVVPEYAVAGGRYHADYALHVDGKSEVVIEAKSLGAVLDGAFSQGINYCTREGTGYLALTDGESWRLYEVHRQVPMPEKLVVSFSLRDGPVESALAALNFWRTRVEAGQIGTIGSPQAMVSTTRSEALEYSAKPSQLRTEQNTSPVQEADTSGWQSLASYEPEAFTTPAEVRLPTGETEKTKNWTELNVKVVAWLVRGGYLTQSQLPVQIGSRYVVAANPVHPNGRRFTSGKRAESVFVETNYAAAYIISNIRHIIEEKTDWHPSQFYVRLGD